MGSAQRFIVISDMASPGPGHLFVIENDDPVQLGEAIVAIVNGLRDGEYRSLRIAAVKAIGKVGSTA